MPVIVKILIDLDLVRRDLGVLTLSAAVVDDTIGWIVLAMISGLVTTGAFEASQYHEQNPLLPSFGSDRGDARPPGHAGKPAGAIPEQDPRMSPRYPGRGRRFAGRRPVAGGA
jgi:hypothetical protein